MPNEKAPRKCCPGPGSPCLAGIDRGHCKDEKQVSGHISCLNPPTLGGTITVSSKPVPILPNPRASASKSCMPAANAISSWPSQDWSSCEPAAL